MSRSRTPARLTATRRTPGDLDSPKVSRSTAAMNSRDVRDLLHAMSVEYNEGRREWRDPRHVIIHGRRLAQGVEVPGIEVADAGFPGHSIAIEIELNNADAVFSYEGGGGIRRIDGAGLWCHDGDGSVDEGLFRSILIPWHRIHRLTAHRAT